MQRFISGKILLPIGLAALLSAGVASGETGPTPPPPSPGATGTLTLTVKGTTTDAPVFAQNGAGVRFPLNAGDNALAPGGYTVIANIIRRSGPIVDNPLIGTATPPTVPITAGGTASRTVTYTPTGGHLWLPVSSTETLDGYGGSQLGVAPTRGPGSVTVTGAGMEPFNTAFDKAGNMYVADFVGNAVLIYSARQIIKSGSGAPTATIGNPPSKPLNGPVGLAFDTGGNLWVGNYLNNSLAKYTAAQLAAALNKKGTLNFTPPVVIRSASFNKPYGHAFDTAGNLWVANNSGNTVVRIAKASLVKTALVNPSSTVPLSTARSPAFDAANNLWVVSASAGKVIKYTINPTTGAPKPASAASLKLANGLTPVRPSGLAFDNAGNLWVSDSAHSVLLKYAVAGLTNGANAKPAKTITGFGKTGGVLLSFAPPPANLPLSR